jgi:cell division transport system permease protein
MLQDFGMVSVSFRRAFKRGALSIFREEGWATAAGSLFGLLLLAQILILLAVGVQGGLGLLRQNTDLRLQVRETATDAQIQDLIQNIRTLPYTEDVVYITREQAYERQRQRDPALVDFLTKFGIDNPFPDTLGVRLRRLDDFAAFLQFLKQPVFATVVDASFLSDTTDQQRQIERLIGVVSGARTVLGFVVGFAVLVLLFVLVELIRRRALMKRQELFVEQLVGAGRLDILLPFMVEMAVLLVIGLVCSVIVGALLLWFLPVLLPALAQDGMFAPWAQASQAVLWAWMPWVLFLEIVGVFLLSAVATLIAFKSQMQAELLPTASFH